MPTRSTLRAPDRLLLILLLALAILLSVATPVRADHDTRVLQLGETLYDVAWEYNTTPETLRWLNDLSPTELPWNGMKLRVPLEEGLVLYRIQAGDTWATIAKAYDTTLAFLVEVNEMSPATRLLAGGGLLVPQAEGFRLTRELPLHIVAEGETVESIATQYDASPRAINRVNNLDGGEPEVGAALLIPPRLLSERLADAERDGYGGYLEIPIDAFPSLTEKWVSVDLSHQRVIAYEGTKPVKSFVISSGRSKTPTVTGVFRIWAKISAQTMEGGSRASGDYYNLPNVQWVSYFYRDYSFHGTYWHSNFGVPMSHGCINMTNSDAQWIYDWMGPQNPGRGWYTTDTEPEGRGTLVVVHR
ncbi:MAG: L,D-transpeptidase family protein [Caldilineaceae bacterium]